MNRLNDGKESHIKAEHFVLCVIGNPCNLVRMQTGIDGVQYTATTAYPEIQLQMAIAIPGQSSYAVTERQLGRVQGVRYLFRPTRYI